MSEEMNLYKRCKNIFKFHGVDMGGGGGESAPEVENAIETHGLGWTDTEEKAGFDIQWDGNTEGLESFMDQVYKVADIGSIASSNDLIGASVEVVGIDLPSPYVLSADDIGTEDDKVFICSVNGSQYVIVALEAGGDLDIPKGVWFFKSTTATMYASRLYKESTTEEVVRQIDQKYIPGGSGGGGGLVVNLTGDDDETWASDKTFPEIKQALENGQFIVVKFSIEGKNYIVSGGTLMPGDTEDYEVIQFMFGATGGAMNCAGNADETNWSLG